MGRPQDGRRAFVGWPQGIRRMQMAGALARWPQGVCRMAAGRLQDGRGASAGLLRGVRRMAVGRPKDASTVHAHASPSPAQCVPAAAAGILA